MCSSDLGWCYASSRRERRPAAPQVVLIMIVVIRDGYLWTCHHVGLSGANGAYSGDQTGTSVDRSAAQWLNFQVGSTGLTFNAYEWVFDCAATNAFWYYMPSLMVN